MENKWLTRGIDEAFRSVSSSTSDVEGIIADLVSEIEEKEGIIKELLQRIEELENI